MNSNEIHNQEGKFIFIRDALSLLNKNDYILIVLKN